MKKQILASVLVGALTVSSAPAWSLFGGDREKTKEYNDKMKKGDENRILFAMIISILDIFIKTPLHGGFCSIKPVRQ